MVLPWGEPGSQGREWAGNTEDGSLGMAAAAEEQRKKKRGRVDLFLQSLPLSHVHEMPSQLPKSKQSAAISPMGWDCWGDTWTNLLLGCYRAHREPPESHAQLFNHMAPVSEPVASLCPLMRHRSAKFRSSLRSLGCLVE